MLHPCSRPGRGPSIELRKAAALRAGNPSLIVQNAFAGGEPIPADHDRRPRDVHQACGLVNTISEAESLPHSSSLAPEPGGSAGSCKDRVSERRSSPESTAKPSDRPPTPIGLRLVSIPRPSAPRRPQGMLSSTRNRTLVPALMLAIGWLVPAALVDGRRAAARPLDRPLPRRPGPPQAGRPRRADHPGHGHPRHRRHLHRGDLRPQPDEPRQV